MALLALNWIQSQIWIQPPLRAGDLNQSIFKSSFWHSVYHLLREDLELTRDVKWHILLGMYWMSHTWQAQHSPMMSFSFGITGLPVGNTRTRRSLKYTIFNSPKMNHLQKYNLKAFLFHKKNYFISIFPGTSVTHDLTWRRWPGQDTESANILKKVLMAENRDVNWHMSNWKTS